jgi:ABC-type glycerol-3-phosphate transport system substrate-binding protein
MKRNLRFPLAGLLLLLATQTPFAAFAADSGKKLEVFSWWTSGGEAAALDALCQAYKKADPGVQIVNATVARCAFTSMGDWTYGEFAKAKWKDNEDFGWIAHPGTDGAFIIVALERLSLRRDGAAQPQ